LFPEISLALFCRSPQKRGWNEVNLTCWGKPVYDSI
jgi:hypothetical protein